ncbi:hypothetical protein KIS4809_2611 [Bacillus sp. ZZV12-4809]|nr:hypothetical protein KIS4809_2611 [Bacillus sp. ZZV12-4809]
MYLIKVLGKNGQAVEKALVKGEVTETKELFKTQPIPIGIHVQIK